jgi:hypothetical protein
MLLSFGKGTCVITFMGLFRIYFSYCMYLYYYVLNIFFLCLIICGFFYSSEKK